MELFERRGDERLTLAAYTELGGSRGPSPRAERVYESTDSRAAGHRQVFLRLVTLGRVTGHAPAGPRSELDALDVGPGGNRHAWWTRSGATDC